MRDSGMDYHVGQSRSCKSEAESARAAQSERICWSGLKVDLNSGMAAFGVVVKRTKGVEGVMGSVGKGS